MQARRTPRAGLTARSGQRGLSTARAALQVAWLLAGRPEGVRADEVAETLGKSVSTAYNLLASLCEEGVAEHQAGGAYRLTPAFRDLVSSGTARAPELHDLSGVVDDLLARTHKRSYLGVMRGGHLHVVMERGVQGMPKLRGLHAQIGAEAHALAMGKIVLALSRAEALDRYLAAGLRAFTPDTITDPDTLRAELQAIRRNGFAVDCEEFDADFCCIAAPVFDPRGRFLAAIGISMTRRAFEDEREALTRTVVGLARTAAGAALPGPRVARPGGSGALPRAGFQASGETRPVLDLPTAPDLASAHGSTAR
jgi:DNA-binding IclR family transcriptional regulator